MKFVKNGGEGGCWDEVVSFLLSSYESFMSQLPTKARNTLIMDAVVLIMSFMVTCEAECFSCLIVGGEVVEFLEELESFKMIECIDEFNFLFSSNIVECFQDFDSLGRPCKGLGGGCHVGSK